MQHFTVFCWFCSLHSVGISDDPAVCAVGRLPLRPGRATKTYTRQLHSVVCPAEERHRCLPPARHCDAWCHPDWLRGFRLIRHAEQGLTRPRPFDLRMALTYTTDIISGFRSVFYFDVYGLSMQLCATRFRTFYSPVDRIAYKKNS